MIQMSRVENCFAICFVCPLLLLVSLSEGSLARQPAQTRVQRSVAASKAVKVSDGLSIQLIADDDLVPDCTAIAMGAGGRLLASGPRYLCELLDQDSDGIYDARRLIVEAPSHGAHGLCIDGDTLYYVGDNGVWKISQSAFEDVNKAMPERVLEIKTGGEHDALAAPHLQFHQGHARAPVAEHHFMPALLRLARRDEGSEAPGVV